MDTGQEGFRGVVSRDPRVKGFSGYVEGLGVTSYGSLPLEVARDLVAGAEYTLHQQGYQKDAVVNFTMPDGEIKLPVSPPSRDRRDK